MPGIPVAGFVLESLGAVSFAVILSSFQRKRAHIGVRNWALGLWLLAAALLASIAVGQVSSPGLRTLVLAAAVVLAYWSPALVLLGTWCRASNRDLARARPPLLIGLAVLGLATVYGAPLAGDWGPLLRAGTRTLATTVAHLAAGVALLRSAAARRALGARVLAVAFLGAAAEDAMFFAVVALGDGRAPGIPGRDVLVEAELVLLMLTGVGMIAWLLEEERESGLKLQEALHRREALSAMGTLVGGVAHEVRNPLFAITATLDAFARRSPGDVAAVPLVAVMREQVQRLSALMTDLLEYGRPIDADLAQHPVAAVAAKAIASCAAASRQAEVSVELCGEPGVGAVLMDESRLLQVFQNVVQNAVEHTPRGGRVRVDAAPEVRRGRSGIRCEVRDAGPGFDPADLSRVFEPFFTRRRGGTGLGLSIVQRIVEQHGGEVRAANHPGGGGVVSVWLPAEPDLSEVPRSRAG